jgi:hypothetical protein
MLPNDVSRTYENTLNRPSEVRSPIREEHFESASNFEDQQDLQTKNDMISIRRLYESLDKKGLINPALTSKPDSAHSNGVSEWCSGASQKIQNSPKKITKKPAEKISEIGKSTNPFNSRCSSGVTKLKPIAQILQTDDSKIVYAWDPQNQSLSAKLKLEHLNSVPVPINNSASLQIAKKPNESAPYLNNTRIPLINNFLFRKMFGNKSSKLPVIKDNSN